MASQPLYRYGGFFYLEDGWVALIGNTEYTRTDLERMDPALNSPEQMAEIAKALAELPEDHVAPKRGQRRRIVPAEGALEGEED